jgi:hypothetical protein
MMHLNGMINRMLKYVIEGVVVAFVAHFLPSMKLSSMELATLGLTAAATFATLDFFAPSIASAARAGSGLSIGSKLTGGF